MLENKWELWGFPLQDVISNTKIAIAIVGNEVEGKMLGVEKREEAANHQTDVAIQVCDSI